MIDRNPKTKKELSEEELNTVAGGADDEGYGTDEETGLIPIMLDVQENVQAAVDPIDELTEAFSRLSLDDDD